MRWPLPPVDAPNRAVVNTAASLFATTVVTSALGYLYWAVAARQLPATTVGFAAAAISAMTLLGMMAVLGLGTLLIGELRSYPGREWVLINTALLVAGSVAAALGLAFAAIAPRLAPELAAVAGGPENLALFTLGVSLTAITLVLDQAMIGLLRPGVQLGRNCIFAVAKLGLLLVVVGGVAQQADGMAVYTTWVAGNVVSVVALAALAVAVGARRPAAPSWSLVRSHGLDAIQHHALNVGLQAPGLALPVLVTAALSAASNAYFYVAWMVAGLIFAGPVFLTTGLYAVGSRQPQALQRRVRWTLSVSFAIAVAANTALLAGTGEVLRFFGDVYADSADSTLRVLGLAVFPLIVRDHYVAIRRLSGQLSNAALFVGAGAVLELALAAIGAKMGGVTGLSFGWVAALSIEAVVMADLVARLAVPGVTQRLGSLEGWPRIPACVAARFCDHAIHSQSKHTLGVER